jgi:hypothetical protein
MFRLASKVIMGILAAAVVAPACGGNALDSGARQTPGNAGSPGGAGTGGARPGGAAGQPATGSPDAAPVELPPPNSMSATLPDGGCVMGAFHFGGGACACQEGEPDVCAEACTDTKLDPANCGACGHACAATSTCNDGRCGPEVTNVVPAAPGCGRLDLAIAGGTLYWSDQARGTVARRALAGGPVTTIASGEKSPSHLLVAGSNLFWIDVLGSADAVNANGAPIKATTASVREVALGGGAPADLVTETTAWGGILGMAVSEDRRTLYYSADTKIRAVPVAGGTPFDVGREERGGVPTALGIEGNSIGYITELNGNVDVITVADGVVASCGNEDSNGNLLMVNCVRLGGCTPDAFMDGFLMHDMNAYWNDGNNFQTGPLTTPHGSKFDVASGLASSEPFTGLAGAPDAVYFSEFATSPIDPPVGLIERTSYDVGSTAVAIARGQNGPRSLAVDDTMVYWSTADCAINSIAR